MPNLFGLDIAAIVNNAITSAGGVLDITLIVVRAGTRDSGDITGGVQPVDTPVAAKGFLENKTDVRIGETIITQGGQFVSILGNSIATGVEPKTNDKVTVEGTTYRIVEVTERDPAGALFVCRIEG